MPDARLGYRNGSNVITTQPTQYATGEPFIAVQDLTPTFLWFDANNFCYLRPGTTQLNTDLYEELAEEAGSGGGGAGGVSLSDPTGLVRSLGLVPMSLLGVGIFDDFTGSTLDSGWDPATGANGTAALDSAAGSHAVLLGTSTTEDEYSTLAYALEFPALRTLTWIETRLKLSVLTDVAFEFGLSDALSETNGLAFSSHDASPVAVATEAAVFGFHHETAGETTANLSLLTAKAGTATQAFSSTALVADTYVKLALAVNIAGDVGFYINETLVGSARAAALTTSAVLTPWLTVKTYNTTAKTLTVDYVRCYGSRG